MFDNSGGPSLELLRFSWKVVASPGFENALRERVELLSQFRHPSFAKVRAVEKLEPKNDLTLVSNCVAGKRLSEGFAALRGPAFAMWLIRELVPALVSLQQQGRGVAHGALTTDRIVLTSEGRLMIVEHVLGSALERLQLSPHEMWAGFGIGVPPTAGAIVTLDCQTDVFQLGLVALSVLLGRSLASYEYPYRLGELLDRFQQSTGRELPSSLRSWLNRALHLADKPFESARDAQNGLGELDAAPASAELSDDDILALAPRSIHRAEQALRPPQEAEPADRTLWSFPQGDDRPETPMPEGRIGRRGIDVAPVTVNRDRPRQREVVAADLLSERRLEMAQHYSRRRIGPGAWGLAGLGMLVFAQAGYIAYLLYAPAPAIVIPAPQPPRPAIALPNAAEVQIPPAVPVQALPPVVAPVPVRSGGVRLISQVEMQLLDGDRILGSSADGPIIVSAGRHEFDLVNSTLGYRSRQVVNVKPGEVLSVAIPHPEGRLSVNAVPWADVWIDGTHIGETPLANIAVPIGQHDVSFRHPTLGEQRRTAIVRFDVPTRLSADLR